MIISLKILCILASFICLSYIYKLIFNYRHLRLLTKIPILNDEKFKWPKVSIISPVCNEAEHIEQAAFSMFKTSYPNVEFIFINDRSTDGTKEILDKLAHSEPRMKLIHNKALPTEWLGKVNALNIGLKKASGEWILFTDADVNYQTDALKKAVYYALNQRLDFLTVLNEIICPSQVTKSLLSYFIHQFLIYENIPEIRSSNPNHAVGQGAFILFKKSAYEKTQGLEWLKQEVIEDMAFAFMMKRSGSKIDILSGVDEVQIKWYLSVKEVIKGFEKNVFASFQYSLFYTSIYCIFSFIFFLAYAVAPFIINQISFYLLMWGSITLYLCTTIVVLRKQVCLPFYSFFIFLLAPLFYIFVILRSAMITQKNKGIYWRGTFYPLDKLKKNQRFKFIDIARNIVKMAFKKFFHL